MILIDHTVVSDDIADQYFVCELTKCKGACCVEGDLGAPLAKDELAILEEVYPKVKPYLSKKGVEVIDKYGTYETDPDGDFVTPTINGRECAYAVYDNKGILKCGIEQAYLDGKINFRKPISCYLYPIRITQYEQFDALNYDRWHICNPACDNGRALGVPLYKFLKDPLITKYGQKWYEKLVEEIEG
ncbi:MAG: DUF3109 family protein [Spirosomaceae bacterium]|jgi:hypothetical protein|nr:DUF3109 family protein [Spirosomataceae bacterium]